MIIYPIIILVLLLIVFIVIWRRAYILESNGQIERKDKEERGGWFHFGRKQYEPEAEIKEETEPNMLKAEELFSKRQYISAEKWYLEAVKEAPKNPKIYARLGTIYIEQKNLSDAKDAFEESVRLDDTVASRFFNLSYIYNSIGDVKEAMANAKKALRLDPMNKKYHRWIDEIRKGKI